MTYCHTHHEPVDEIYINFVVHPSSNFTAAINATGRYQKGTTTVSFRLTCSPHWYGQDCGTFCMPQNNSKLICNNDGDKVCLKGWTGTNCSAGMQRSLLSYLSIYFLQSISHWLVQFPYAYFLSYNSQCLLCIHHNSYGFFYWWDHAYYNFIIQIFN